MAVEKTETHEIKRGDGVLTLKVTFTPRQGGYVKIYRLKMEVESAVGCQPEVFVYQRSTAGAPMDSTSPVDEFVCVADELDEYEIPKDEPNLKANIPYYRVSTLELIFRNSDMMYESAHEIIRSIRA